MEDREKNIILSDQEIVQLDFDEAMSKVESILDMFDENDKIPLEDSIKYYEYAVKLKKHCEEKLEQAKVKIEELSK